MVDLAPGDLAVSWPAVKASLDAGDRTVRLAPGRYTAGRTGSRGCWYLVGYDDLIIDCRGAVIEQTADDAQDYAVFYLSNCARPTIDSPTLIGHHRGTNEQTHGIVLHESTHPTVIRPTLHTQRGDGIKLISYKGAVGGTIRDSRFRECGRSGITLHSGYAGLVIDGMDAEGISDQAIDCEHLLAKNITVRHARIRVTGHPRIALTVSESDGLLLEDVRIEGGTLMGVRAKDLTLRDVHIDGGGPGGPELSALDLYYSVDGCVVDGGRFVASGSKPAVRFEHKYNVESYRLERIRLRGVEAVGRVGFASGAGGRDIELDSCHAISPETRGRWGFLIDGPSANPWESVVLRHCTARGFEGAGLVKGSGSTHTEGFRHYDCDAGLVA